MIFLNNEKYFTPKEIAEMFQVSMSTVARWRANGKLESHQINERKHLFSETAVEVFMRGGK